MLSQKDLKKETLFASLNIALAQPEAVYKLKLTPTNSTGLKEVRTEMQSFKNLQYLDLSGCGWVRELPDWIGDFTNLQTLKLSEMGLQSLPKTLENLTNLETLDVAFNLDLLDISPVFQVKSLKKLTFDCRGPLTAELGNLENLEDLLVSELDDSEAMEHIYTLPNLKKLELLGENLTTLKTGISNLKKLETLNITVAPLLRLPDDFGILPKLKTFAFTGLYNIYLSNYTNPNFKIEVDWAQVFEQLAQIKTLQTVDLSDNCVKKYDETIELLTQIKRLNLNDMVRNATEDPFPKSFENLKNLKELIVSDRDATWESVKNWTMTLPNTKVVFK